MTHVPAAARPVAAVSPPLPHRGAAAAWQRTKLFAQILRNRLTEDQTIEQAAALAYHTLFSLLPIFVLIVLVLSMISRGGQGTIDQQVKHFLYQQFKLDALSITDQASGHPINLPDLIDRQIDRAREVVQNPITGIVGFGILVYGGINLMLVIERAFNRIYGSPKPRSWSRKLTQYWCVLTLGPLSIAASLAATNVFFQVAQSYAYARIFLAPATILTGFFVSWLFMIVLYKIVPNTHVGWSSACLGGFVGAMLWELGKNLIGLYVRKTVGGNNWYGTLALVPLFMFWIYCTWNFILLGLQVAYVHQFLPVLQRRWHFQKACNTTITDLRWVLPLGVLLYRRFHEGQVTLAYEAANELNLPTEVADELLRGLQQAGLVHCLDTRSNGYALARPPEMITAHDLIHAAKALCSLPAETVNEEHGPASPAHTPALAEIDAMSSSWYRSHTLADLAGGPAAAAPGEDR